MLTGFQVLSVRLTWKADGAFSAAVSSWRVKAEQSRVAEDAVLLWGVLTLFFKIPFSLVFLVPLFSGH